MEYRRLGVSSLEVSVFAFGAWQIGDPEYWGPDADSDYDGAVHAALDAGINLFDTAELYGAGESERALGRALGAQRDRVLIASKVMSQNCTPEKLRRACEDSLARLGTDRIDLYQIHWPFYDVPFEDAYAELCALKREGKIREIGVSNFGPRDLDHWMAVAGCVSDQLAYNLVFRAIEYEIVPACLKHRAGILVYVPLLQGILAGRWKSVDEIPQQRRRFRHFSRERSGTRHGEPGCEALLFDALAQVNEVAIELGRPMADVALAWLAAQPGVTSVIVGARDPAQLVRNAAAAGLVLSPALLGRLDAITTPIKQQMGPNADLWLGTTESRIH